LDTNNGLMVNDQSHWE